MSSDPGCVYRLHGSEDIDIQYSHGVICTLYNLSYKKHRIFYVDPSFVFIIISI